MEVRSEWEWTTEIDLCTAVITGFKSEVVYGCPFQELKVIVLGCMWKSFVYSADTNTPIDTLQTPFGTGR